MWSDYRGGKPASEMGPPAKIPSATIRPRREHDLTLDCWCRPTVEQVPPKE